MTHMLTERTRENVTLLGGAAILAVLLPFAIKPMSVPPPAASQDAPVQDAGLQIPTIDQMCAMQGAAGDALEACREDETAAQEYVGAWMDYNGFINEGGLDLGQIELLASLADNDPLLANPLTDTDPATAIPGVDTTPDQFQSPAQLALFCLTGADDWVRLHDCLAENDRDAVTGDADLLNPPPDFDPSNPPPGGL